MKIKLISPANKSKGRESLWDLNVLCDLMGAKAPCAPLPLLTIASYTPPEFELEIIDENVTEIDFESPADLVGISFLTAQAKRAYEISREFKKRKTTVVLGGVHPTMLPSEALAHVDSIIIGEAESLWPKLLNDFKKGSLKNIYKQETAIDLGKAKLPKWNLVDEKDYFTLTLQTSRGCPNNCNFCSVTQLNGHKIRHKPLDLVMREVRLLKGLSNKKTVFFVDDNLFADKAYGLSLVRKLKKEKIRWMCQASLKQLDDENLLTAMHDSGCSSVFIGFESVSENSLRSMSKEKINRPNKYSLLIEKIHRAGISIFGSFILGNDADPDTIFADTFDFINDNNLAYAMINVLTPFPGTALFKKLEKENRIINKNWLNYDGESLCFEPVLDKDLLIEGRAALLKNIYSYKEVYKRLSTLWARDVLTRKGKMQTIKGRLISILYAAKPGSRNLPFAVKSFWKRKNASKMAVYLAINFNNYAENLTKKQQ